MLCMLSVGVRLPPVPRVTCTRLSMACPCTRLLWAYPYTCLQGTYYLRIMGVGQGPNATAGEHAREWKGH